MNDETRALIEAEKNTTIAPPVSASSVPSNIGRGEPTSNSDSIIAAQKEKDLSEIKDNEKFKQLSKAITEREIGYKLQENALTIQGKEFQNQYDEYVLKKKKEALAFRIKKERNIVSQQVKAELNEEKRRISEKRFGYLYEADGTYTYYEKDVSGKLIELQAIKYKNFTPSYSINRLKELQNWYKNQTETAQKAIWTTVKFVFFSGIAVASVFIIIKLLRWLAVSGALGAVFGA